MFVISVCVRFSCVSVRACVFAFVFEHIFTHTSWACEILVVPDESRLFILTSITFVGVANEHPYLFGRLLERLTKNFPWRRTVVHTFARSHI